MKPKPLNILVLLTCAISFSSCAAFHNPGEKITLHDAVEASTDALNLAYQKAKDSKTTWGLLPAEVTLTYHISAERGNEVKAGVAAGYSSVTLSSEVAVTTKEESDNTVVMKFTRHGR